MTTLVEQSPQTEIVYPESDGQPMADNTKQFRWIVTIENGLEAQFQDRSDVFVAGDLLWYPVEGQPSIRMAPDVLVAFGRPKGDRGSYQQWREGGIAPQVVFEILSPGNTVAEMVRKFRFYNKHNVEEYYIYDPDKGELSGWIRSDGELTEIETMKGWVSPRLGVRFEIHAGELALYHADGSRFARYIELMREREVAQRQAAEERRKREAAQQQATEAQQRADRLAAQLRALGVEPNTEE